MTDTFQARWLRWFFGAVIFLFMITKGCSDAAVAGERCVCAEKVWCTPGDIVRFGLDCYRLTDCVCPGR